MAPIPCWRRETEVALAEARREKDGDDAYDGMHCNRAAALDPSDLSIVTKRGNANFSMDKYKECVMDCEEVVKRGSELRSNKRLVAEALSLKGLALINLAACAADHEPAIRALLQSLDKHRSRKTKDHLDEAVSRRNKFEERDDQKAAQQHRDRGLELHCQRKYEEVAKQFTEAIRINPTDPKNFRDRAKCHIELNELTEGLEDAEKCIELNPNFGMGYVCKGLAQFLMGKYVDAVATYADGLKHDPKNLEIHDGLKRCVERIKIANGIDARAEDLMKDEREMEHLRNELQKRKIDEI